MTASELLALLGRAWFQLLIYPGGLCALALAALLGGLGPRGLPAPAALRRGLAGAFAQTDPAALSALAAPWLGVALLPLPGAAALARPLDLVGVLALLEWPLLLALRAGLRDPDPAVRRAAGLRLAAALNSYPPLLLALLLLARAGGSLQIERLVRLPEAAGPAAATLHWLGACALLLALPPALGIGPFHHPPRVAGPGTEDEGRRTPAQDKRRPTQDEDPAPSDPAADTAAGTASPRFAVLGSAGSAALRLRAVGLAALAALPWCAALERPAAWLAPLPLLLAGPLLLAVHRLTHRASARRWAQAYLALDVLLLLALALRP